MKKTRYYSSFEDDFAESAQQDFKLPEDYKWIRTGFVNRLLSGVVYGLAVVFGTIYCRLFLHMKIRGKKKLRKIKGGYFIYGNHTQPVGDVFIPALCAFPKRIYTVVSTANYGIPVIGKVLPFLGALPVAQSVHGIKELGRAIEKRLGKGHPVVIYPEAHVWEYYTGIRPFSDTSFKFPARFQCPVFAVTVTYKKSRIFRKPVAEVFIDGPFCSQANTPKESARDLCRQVREAMTERSKNSNCDYIEYKEKAE